MKIALNDTEPYSSNINVTTLESYGTKGIFNTLKIIAYGTYFLNLFVSQDANSSITKQFEVINKIKNFTFESISETANYQNFSISAKVYGIDDAIFKVKTNYSLNYTSTQLVVIKFSTITDGYISFTVYSKKVGDFMMKIVANYSNFISESIQVEKSIYKSKLILSSDLSNVVTGTGFFIKYQLIDNITNEVLTNFHDEIINLALNCESDDNYTDCSHFEYTGLMSQSSNQGEIHFKDLIINQSSKFSLTATAINADIDPLTSGPYISYIKPEFDIKFSAEVINI